MTTPCVHRQTFRRQHWTIRDYCEHPQRRAKAMCPTCCLDCSRRGETRWTEGEGLNTRMYYRPPCPLACEGPTEPQAA